MEKEINPIEALKEIFGEDHVFVLDELVYASTEKGPWVLYLFNKDGYHRGKQWFDTEIRYPDEEITVKEAFARTLTHIASGNRVMVCDGDDHVVFLYENGQVKHGQDFWKKVISG